MVSMQMDENSPSPQPFPTPQCVGREFVRQYYTLLAEAPRYVHRFYSNESIFVHGTDTEEVIGQTAIQNKIRELSFTECRTRIRALDAHETLGKGVVVQVVGEISISGSPMRRFVQTFVLAPQSEKKYYVHNDIFRYEDELFSDKLAQENGAPADPDAEASIEHGQINEEVKINNGTVHPEEVQHLHFSMPQGMQQAELPQQAEDQAADARVNGSVSVGVVSLSQTQDSSVLFVDGNAGHGTAATVTAAQAVQKAGALPTASFGQQPLPQRPQAQQTGQNTLTSSAAVAGSSAKAQISIQAESVVPSGGTEQSQEPPLTDKTSPVPSEEREEAAENASGEKSWANVAKQKSNRASYPISTVPQQPLHTVPTPGTSAPGPPFVASGAFAIAHGGQAHADQPSKSVQSSRQPHRPQRQVNSNTAAGTGPENRSSPAPNGGQQFAGVGNRQNAVESYPVDQQVFLKNLPFNTGDEQLKAFFDSVGVGKVQEIRICRKSNPQQQQSCFGFLAFDTAEAAHKVIQQRTFNFHGHEIIADVKRQQNEKSTGGGSVPFNGRPFVPPGPNSYLGVGSMVRGGVNARGMRQRGGTTNRPPSGIPYGVGQGGGPRPLGRVFSSTTGRGGGIHHP